LTLTFEPMTPKSLGILCYPGWMCGPKWRILAQLTLVTLNF